MYKYCELSDGSVKELNEEFFRCRLFSTIPNIRETLIKKSMIISFSQIQCIPTEKSEENCDEIHVTTPSVEKMCDFSGALQRLRKIRRNYRFSPPFIR